MTTSPLDELFEATAGGDFVANPLTNQRFEVTKAEATSSKAGDPQLKFTLTARGGPENGHILIHRMTYKTDSSEGAKSIINRSLQALGVTPDFAKEVAANVPASSQVITLFLEVAKIAVGKNVLADVVPQGGDGEYKDRMQVSYALKVDKDAGAVTTPVAAAVASGNGAGEVDEVAALKAKLAALEPAAATAGADAPPF